MFQLCSYQRDLANGTYEYQTIKNPLPPAVVNEMKPLFDRLRNETFSTPCEQNKTQNKKILPKHILLTGNKGNLHFIPRKAIGN